MKQILVLLSLAIATSSFAQPAVDFWRLYDEAFRFDDIYPRTGGGYYVCGRTARLQACAIQLNEEGNVVWSHNYDAPHDFASLIEANNGDIVACGGRDLYYNQSEIYAVRINHENGDLIWSHAYGGGYCHAVIELKAGDFVLAGSFYDQMLNWRGCLIRIDGDGNVVWSREYANGDNRHRDLNTMRETDDGIVAAGGGGPDAHHIGCGWVIKADFNGDLIWSRFVDPNSNPYFYAMVSMPGGFALADFLHPNLIFIDNQGEVVSRHPFDIEVGTYHETYGLARLQDGGFCLVGNETGEGLGQFALRTDRNGNRRWISHFREQLPENLLPCSLNDLTSVIVVGDNQLVACGQYYTADNGHGSGLVVRLRPDEVGPQLFYRIPKDSIQTVLAGDSIQFIVRARNNLGQEFNHQWSSGDSLMGRDTVQTVVFDTPLGDYPINCYLSDSAWHADTGWMVRVRDFFIAAHTPDTLNLSVRRGTSVNFSIDSVTSVNPGPVDYSWMLTDLSDSSQENVGLDSSLELAFPILGRYTLDGLAYNRESQDEVIWQIAVRSLIGAFYPEALALTVDLDSTVTFDVLPFDPNLPSLSYRWYLDGDSVGAAAEQQQRFSIEGLHHLSGIVSDSSDADTIVWNVSVRPNSVASNSFQLSTFNFQLSPNPFNARSIVHFALPVASTVRLTLHELTGREVRLLVNGKFSVGEHQLALDAAELPTGLYFLRLEAAGKIKIAKAVVIR